MISRIKNNWNKVGLLGKILGVIGFAILLPLFLFIIVAFQAMNIIFGDGEDIIS